MNPIAIEVALIAAAISIGSAIVNKIVVDQKRMKQVKGRISEINKKYKSATATDEEKKEMMDLSKEMMKNSFRPMMFTFVPIILVVFGMNTMYGKTGNIVNVPVFGELNWFWWYFVVSVLAGISFEVAYKVYTKNKEKKEQGNNIQK